jgi:hypothetical protein
MLSGAIILTLGILSVGPDIHATEPIDGDANKNATGAAFAPDPGRLIKLPFQPTENLSLGAVIESPDEAAEADKVPNEDWAVWPHRQRLQSRASSSGNDSYEAAGSKPNDERHDQ